MKTEATFVPGLEGVIAAETSISLLDTEQEKIVIKGYDLIELSKENDYLDIVHLLLENTLPTPTEKRELKEKVKMNDDVQTDLIQIFQLLSKQTHPMDGLRTGISVLSGYDTDVDNRALEVNKNRAYELLAKLPTITVNSYRIVNNEEPVQPHLGLSYSANFLYMI